MKPFILLCLFIVSGCASTRIAPIGPDTYLIHKTGGFGSNAGSAQMDALQEASKYCSDNGKQLVVLSTQSQGVSGFQYPNADIQFRCLSQNDPDLKRPTLEPIQDNSPQPQQVIAQPQKPVNNFQPITPYQMPKQKQTDANCVQNCTRSGSLYSFCESKCSY